MQRINEIKELLGKYDYITTVRKTGDGIVVLYPHPKLIKPRSPRIKEAYGIQRGERTGVYYNSNIFPDEKFIGVPEYAVRMYLVASLIHGCNRTPINSNLIQFFDENGGKYDNIEDIVSPPSTPEDVQREVALANLIYSPPDDLSSPECETAALHYKVHEGFRLLQPFFAK